MKILVSYICFLTFQDQSFAPFKSKDFKALHTHVCQWQRDIKKGMRHEFWTKVNETTMTSKSLNISGKDTRALETVVLKFLNAQITDTVTVPVQNNEKPVTFTLQKIENKTFFFEKIGHDFPQRIIYNLNTKGKLLASIEGKIGDTFNKVDFNFSKMD